jgi:polyribonucleotide nucleotidyltransferase
MRRKSILASSHVRIRSFVVLPAMIRHLSKPLIGFQRRAVWRRWLSKDSGVMATNQSSSASQSTNFGALLATTLGNQAGTSTADGVVKGGDMQFGFGALGNLAEGNGICRHGGTVTHCAVVTNKYPDGPVNELMLHVDYRDREYAYGSIPSSKSRREKHNGDDEILVARVIDRALRPLFPKGYVGDIQLTVTAHASDGVNDPLIAAVNSASLALMHSSQPWYGPIGCVRVGLIDGVLKVNPSKHEMATSDLDFVYAGTSTRPLM